MGAILQALLLDIPQELETERLALRASAPGQGAAIHEAVMESMPQLKPWMPWALDGRTPEDSERHCREMAMRWLARQELDFCFFSRADGGLVGKGGLHTIDWAVPKFEIGYWIRTSCARRGYATEAAQRLVRFAREDLGAERLEITSDARNAASRRVAEKAGFSLEGIRRHSRRDAEGKLADSCLYAKVF